MKYTMLPLLILMVCGCEQQCCAVADTGMILEWNQSCPTWTAKAPMKYCNQIGAYNRRQALEAIERWNRQEASDD